MKWLIGLTGYSFFDVWSIVHLSFWIFIGSTLWAFGTNRWISLASCLAVAYLWEVFEYFMAPRHPTVWKSPESWSNSWISDPLTCVIGVLVIWWLLDHKP